MAIPNAEKSEAPDSSPGPNPRNRPAFFLRTLIPKSAITCSISLSLFPPHAHSRQPHLRLSPARQLVTAHSTLLSVYSVCDSTLSLRPICQIPLFVPVIALASLPSHSPSRDVLLALTTASKVAFFRYDDRESTLVLAGDVTSPYLGPSAYLLATHPTKSLVAVATLLRSLIVFPLLFLPTSIAAGKPASIPLSGTPLSLSFLHDDGGKDAILIVLLQHKHAQILTLFTITPTSDGITVSRTANMIPCVNRPGDSAIARAASKLIGEPRRYVPSATAVTKLTGCPYMFVVVIPGKVVAGDARPVLKGIEDGNPAPITVCLENEEEEEQMPESLRYFSVASSTTGEREALGAAESLTPTQTPERVMSEAPVSSTTSRRGSRMMYEGGGIRRGKEGGGEYMSYLSVPAYVTLETGEGLIPMTAWADAKDHFLDENDDTNGLYFVTGSGAMFVLRWSESVQEGTATFQIPGDERLTEPKKNFYVSFVGDVGPAVSIAALDHKLIFIANDGADGSLRKLHLPKVDLHGLHPRVISDLRGRGVIKPEQRRFGLEVRQEFLNLAPISDFVIVPSARRQKRREKRPRGTVGDEGNRQSFGKFEAKDEAKPLGRPAKTESIFEIAMDVDENEERKSLQFGNPKDFRTHVQEAFEPEEGISTLNHVLHGGSAESEIIVCSGLGRRGTVRLIRPGGPVNIFASSANTFVACNDMFPIRFTKGSVYHAGISLTFAQSTGILYSVPIDTEEQMEGEDDAPAIAKLIDGTKATGIHSSVRTIAIGVLEDGVLAQVHENGIRTILLKKTDKLPTERLIEDGVLMESICENVVDWTPPEGGFISVGTIGAGFVLVCVIQNAEKHPLLCLLKLTPDDFNNGLCIVSSVPLEQELSCISILEWVTVQSDLDFVPPRSPPMAVLGTYLPSIELRLLGPTMEVLDRRMTYPWGLYPHCERNSVAKGNDTMFDVHLTSLSREQHSVATPGGSWRKPSSSTAVPESLCAVVFGGKQYIFVGLRDGSVVCFLFGDTDGDENMDPGPSNAGINLLVDSHKKLGHRPVVLKAAIVAIGQVVIGQAERPWMCTNVGGARMRWIPLSFTETSAMCAYSILGAERCLAAVGEEGALHICGIRRRSEVSVRSIHVGSTPRRVLAVSYPDDSIIVATSHERRIEAGNSGKSSSLSFESRVVHMGLEALGLEALGGEAAGERIVNSELRVYNRKLRLQTGSISLLAGEQVYVLLSWLGFVVVGTSNDIRVSHTSASQKICRRGRLRLLSLRSKGGASASSALAGRTKFSVCSEVVLPGAVLSGAAHPSASVLIVSCNEEVIVFGVLRSRRVLIEITRVSFRALVVSISIYNDLICVADRKDSITFYTLIEGKLVRDRSDRRRRIVSDAVLVNRTLAVAVDRRGALFSVGYEEGDAPTPPPAGSVDITGVQDLLETYESLATVGQAVDAALGTQGRNRLSLDGFGEEYDAIHSEESAENFAESSDFAQEAEATMDASVGQASSESDHVMAADSTESQDENASGNWNGMEDAEDVMNAANPTQPAVEDLVTILDQPNIPGITNALANILNQGAVTGPFASNRNDRNTVPRNLVCYHSFNLNDISLRIRHGSFNRGEKVQDLEELKPLPEWQSAKYSDEPFWEASSAVFCVTVGGALMAATPMHAWTFTLLSRLEAEMSVYSSIAMPALGSCHEKFRAAFDRRAEGVIDGDLLKHFNMLNRSSRMEICSRVGYPGEEGMLYIEGLIQSLSDGVA